MKRLVVFACKRGRPRDIPLLRAGARAAGLRFLMVLVPWAVPALIVAALARSLGLSASLVISDRFAGDQWIARLFGADSIRMLWNYADEFPDTLVRTPPTRVSFFEDPDHSVRLFRFAPQPSFRPPRIDARREICFVGDVSLDFEVPGGVTWWADQLALLRDRHGFGFYLTPDHDDLIRRNAETPAQARTVRVLCKNLIRLWVVKSVRSAFGDRLVLVGSNWRRFGIDALPSAYTYGARMRRYESSVAHLDCGSKSGDSALYPRSSEIISFAGSPVQVTCADSAQVYGTRVAEFAFRNETQLHGLIDQRLIEPERIRAERAVWLADQLALSGLTMADSWRELLNAVSNARPEARSTASARAGHP